MGLNRQLANLPDAITTDTSNNVGIGGAANASFKLQVTGSGAFNGGATGLILNLDANVSIAKSISFRSNNSPRMSVEVSGSENGSNTGANFQIKRFSDAGSLIDTPFEISRETGNSTFSSNLLFLSKNQNGFTNFYIENTTGGTASGGGYIIRSDFGSDFAQFGKFSTLTTAIGIRSPKDAFMITDNGSIAILTSDAAGTIKMAAGNSSTAHLTIASTGAATFSSNVGVGGNSTNRLTVLGSETGTQITTNPIGKFANTGNSFSKLVLGSDNANYDAVVSMDNNATLANCKLRFYIGNGTGSTAGHSNDQLVLQGNGNVGIGTSSPSSLLHAYVNAVGTVTVARFAAANYSSPSSKTYIQIGTQYDDGSSRIGSSNPSSNLSELFFETATTASGVFAERMRITSVGNVLIGTTNDVGQRLRIYQPTNGNWNIKMIQPNSSSINFQEFLTTTDGDATNTARGSITYNGTNVLYNGTSDYRLKDDLKDYNALDIVSQLKTYDFKWKEADTRDYGMMAHELQEVLPNYVTGQKDELNEDGSIKPQGVDYSKIVPILIKSIQEQQIQIQNLQEQINILAK